MEGGWRVLFGLDLSKKTKVIDGKDRVLSSYLLQNSIYGVRFCNFVASTFYSRHILYLPQVLRVNIQKKRH